MATLSPARQSVDVLKWLTLLHRGKVRDTYALKDPSLRLIVATDGLSIFDFVLDALVPGKGMILTAMSHFWLTMLEKKHGIRTHLVAAGAEIDQYLPQSLRGQSSLQTRAMVVRKLDMSKAEFIARGYLTGSGLQSYKATGSVCGIALPPGLQDGDELAEAIATPTTKAEEGHDEPLDAAEILAMYPEQTAVLMQVYNYVRMYARTRGILFADTKLEFGIDQDGQIVLGDEVATPDSSRWWEYSEWMAGRLQENRKAPPPFDKQLVRAAGMLKGIHKLDPCSSADTDLVHNWQVPQELLEATAQTYRYIFWRLTGMTLEGYQQDVLHIPVAEKKRSLAVVFGSESDVPHVADALRALSEGKFSTGISEFAVHVVSCHRNPDELRKFVKGGCGGADVVIAAGGKAFALPGVHDALLYAEGRRVPVIGVALGKEGSQAFEAAKLSIVELPSLPVVIDEVSGKAYENIGGFMAALSRVAYGEFPVPKERPVKPARFNINWQQLV